MKPTTPTPYPTPRALSRASRRDEQLQESARAAKEEDETEEEEGSSRRRRLLTSNGFSVKMLVTVPNVVSNAGSASQLTAFLANNATNIISDLSAACTSSSVDCSGVSVLASVVDLTPTAHPTLAPGYPSPAPILLVPIVATPNTTLFLILGVGVGLGAPLLFLAWYLWRAHLRRRSKKAGAELEQISLSLNQSGGIGGGNKARVAPSPISPSFSPGTEWQKRSPGQRSPSRSPGPASRGKRSVQGHDSETRSNASSKISRGRGASRVAPQPFVQGRSPQHTESKIADW